MSEIPAEASAWRRAGANGPGRSSATRAVDPDFQRWRDDQLDACDRDYFAWRKERFRREFEAWRRARHGEGASGAN
jgi:hypothetical protein